MPANALAVPVTQTKPPWQYGIVLDAGSSGTRLHIYRWASSNRPPYATETDEAAVKLHSLPILETKKKWTKKVKPGVSTFGTKPRDVGPEHIQEFLARAKQIIPPELASTTPFFLLATAGLRLLPETQQKAVLEAICSYVRKESDFWIPDCSIHIRVIPGNVEGLYGWIAANYLLGGFEPLSEATAESPHHRDHTTFGFLDMGGASAQIAFAPNATETERHAEDLTLLRLRTLGGYPREYRVFTTTWLGFGVNEARRRYVESLSQTSNHSLDESTFPRINTTSSSMKFLQDPCLPPGLNITPRGDVFLPDSQKVEQDKTPVLHGVGNFSVCLERTLPLLEKDHICVDEPCLLGGVHVPAIDFDINHFVGVSEYWHTTHEIFEIEESDKSYDFNTYQQRVREFCQQDWTSIEQSIHKQKWGKHVDERTAVEVCFKASWLINILHEGIGIPRVGLEDTPDSKDNATSKLTQGVKDKVSQSASDSVLLGNRTKEPSFRAINKIDDVEVSWTLGKMLLYACSQIPPKTTEKNTDVLSAVGFGTNSPGLHGKLPADFQFPSIDLTKTDSHSSSAATNSTSSSTVHDTNSSKTTESSTSSSSSSTSPQSSLLGAAKSHRIPGVVLFLLIICFAGYLLLGKTRRQRIISATMPSRHPSPNRRRHESLSSSNSKRTYHGESSRSSASLLGIKLPFSLRQWSHVLAPFSRRPSHNRPQYEPVIDLEDGHTLANPDLFELDANKRRGPHSGEIFSGTGSDHSDSSSASRTHGWDTPRLRGNGPYGA